MENGTPKDLDRDMEEMSMQISRLQTLTTDLKSGLMGAVQDLCALKNSSCSLEDRIRGYHSDITEKMLGIRNCLDSFKEDMSVALSQIKELNCRHAEMHEDMELFREEAGRHPLASEQRKNSKDVFADCPQSFPGETEAHSPQPYRLSSPYHSPDETMASEQDSSNQQQDWTRCQVWAGPKSPSEGQGAEDGRKRYTAALELLESERLYVSHLSLLLKANITFNGVEALHPKGKRPFPSSLRFLIQQHLELLHTLQERVLRFQWQGIMGDVFLRLFSKESDFLNFYVTYLKELPDCLSVVSMYTSSSTESSELFEYELIGKEARLPVRSLLLQPVQRIPEYLSLLQNLLKLTEADHPDYFLLLVCTQQLRAFSSHHSLLMQRNQELLPGYREAKRQPQKPVKRKVLEQRQSKDPQDWEFAGAPLSPGPVFWGEAGPWRRSPVSEARRESSTCPPAFKPVPGFLTTPPSETLGLEVLYKDADSLGNVSLSLFENGSFASSDSSMDMPFLQHSEAYAAGRTQTRLPERDQDSTSPDDSELTRHDCPLKSIEWKSKSLNGLQLGSTVCGDMEPPEFQGAPKPRSPCGTPHARLQRQSSRGSAGGKAQCSISPLQKLEPQDVQRDVHKGAPPSQSAIKKLQLATSADDNGPQASVEEPRRRHRSEENARSFSVRSRKEDQKGGFRSSFRKLFKKKSSGETKEKAREKSAELEAYSDHDCVKYPQVAYPSDVDRGTAV